MKNVIERVKAERAELAERLSRLYDFMDTRFKECKFVNLSPANQILLVRQRDVMNEYRDILDVRIALMESEAKNAKKAAKKGKRK